MKCNDVVVSTGLHHLPLCSLRMLSDEDARQASLCLVSMDPWITLKYTNEGLRRYLLRFDPGLSRYGIIVSEDLAGVICVRYPWLLGPCIELLAIFPSHQARGIGHAVIQWVESEFQGRAKNIWTLVSSFNEEARRFYKHAGFAEMASIPDLVATGSDELLLRKRMQCS